MYIHMCVCVDRKSLPLGAKSERTCVCGFRDLFECMCPECVDKYTRVDALEKLCVRRRRRRPPQRHTRRLSLLQLYTYTRINNI